MKKILAIICATTLFHYAAKAQTTTHTNPGTVFGFTQPAPLDFDDHEDYVSLFDGSNLTDWDGNMKFWRAENGAIVGESTKENPSGNTYLVYKGMKAKDFTLKLRIKVEGDGGSGIQYRSVV